MPGVVRGPWGQGGRHPLWAALWPQLSVLPSPGQDAVLKEIASLLRTARAEPIHDHAAWLRGLLTQASPDLWPPQDYAKVLAILKAKKTQLITLARVGQLRTSAQNKRLWVALAAPIHTATRSGSTPTSASITPARAAKRTGKCSPASAS